MKHKKQYKFVKMISKFVIEKDLEAYSLFCQFLFSFLHFLSLFLCDDAKHDLSAS